jgi:hypothetical protein
LTDRVKSFLKHNSDPDTEFVPAMGAGIVNPLATVEHQRRPASRRSWASRGAFRLLQLAQCLVEIFQSRQRERQTGRNLHDLALHVSSSWAISTQTPIADGPAEVFHDGTQFVDDPDLMTLRHL